RNRLRGQGKERSLHVGWFGRWSQRGDASFEPWKMEPIAAGALRRRTREIRIGLERAQQRRIKLPGRSPCAIAIEGRARVTFAPGIEQRVARSGVEATHRPERRQVGEIGDAAQIDDDTMPIVLPEQRSVQRGHQRSPLPSGSYIATAKVGDHRDAGCLREPRGVGKLCRITELGTVPNRLAVYA